MAKVVWRSRAVDDIRAIAGYLSDHDPLAADDMAIRLFELGESLAIFPRRGRIAGKVSEMTNVPPYILRYEVVDDEVFILSVHHGARNID